MSNYKCGHSDIEYTNSDELCRKCRFKKDIEDYDRNDPIKLFNQEHNLTSLIEKTPKHTKWAYTIRVNYVQRLIKESKDYSFVNAYVDPDYWVNNEKGLLNL